MEAANAGDAIPTQEEKREEDRRHAITEILFFASVGDVAKIRALCLKVDISVSPILYIDESVDAPASSFTYP
jgi:hypothetical protein